MGNSASADSFHNTGLLLPKPQTQHEEFDHQEITNRSKTWVPPVDYLKHKQRGPVADPDISIQNCSNLGINVGSEGAPYKLCMCTIATHGEFEDTPLEPESDEQTFVVPRNAKVFVFSAAAPGCISIGHSDAGPPAGRTMRDLFPNVYTPIDRNVPPITIAETRHIIKNADKAHIMNTKINAIRDSALNFTYMDETTIKLNLERLSDALKIEDQKTIYLPLKKEYTSKENTPGYKFTRDDNFEKDYLDTFLTSHSYSVRQYNSGESMYIKKYTVNNTDRGATIDYSYDFNIFELFSGCNLTKFLSRNSRTGRNYVTNQTIIEYCARVAEEMGIICAIILFDLSCSVFTYKGRDVTPEDKAILKKNLTVEIDAGEMDAGGARNKRKHITHRKKNIKNRKINIKPKKRQTKRKRRNNIKI